MRRSGDHNLGRAIVGVFGAFVVSLAVVVGVGLVRWCSALAVAALRREQVADVAGSEPPVTAERLDTRDTPSPCPTRHRLSVDAEHHRDLRRGQQLFGLACVSQLAPLGRVTPSGV